MNAVSALSMNASALNTSAASVTSVNVPTAASMSAQVAARTNRVAGDTQIQSAGQTRTERTPKLKTQVDLLAQMQAIEAQLAARAQQAGDVNALDITYNKKQAMLSVKVKEQQTGDLVRELQFKDYKAMAYSNHGYKGAYVDITA
jgi:uncharacterized FlaG/YvyC family protein